MLSRQKVNGMNDYLVEIDKCVLLKVGILIKTQSTPYCKNKWEDKDRRQNWKIGKRSKGKQDNKNMIMHVVFLDQICKKNRNTNKDIIFKDNVIHIN